ncbi:CHAT domain-containing protein [Corticibacter populi]|uniref:CHAT domain-containing protein n=1 Tax=Corticibacter populi TaxID=1550736 RepID=A0A3M6QMG5_9BURK|nr:CHAT domain-containing protein [Corticibacter populi]RMX04236.1 CHAT domain-containing protein [Corticibacter populi]RZS33273.1 CHAT domain-containing protein [Corticibacter populi]
MEHEGRQERRADRRWQGALCWLACVGFWWSAGALAQPVAAPVAAATAPAPAPALALVQQSRGRLDDADTLLGLTTEGAILYGQDAVKLTGYQYCSQAVALAEQGEFRQSLRAASKALHLAQANDDPELLGRALRDLAIVFSYAGQLDKAAQFANEALAVPVQDAGQVAGPARKVLGDVQMRQGEAAAAVRSYEAALPLSSPRYRPLVEASLANALIATGDTARAAALLAQIAPPQDDALALQLHRTRASLLLAQGHPQQARAAYAELAAMRGGTDTGYYRIWALEGMARSDLMLGNRTAAAQALQQALLQLDGVRARFRSDEFKMGLFSDLQGLFEQTVALETELGNPAGAFEASERSRSRALLDAVRGRASAAAQSLEQPLALATLQQTLRADERIVQFHTLPDALLVWVVSPDAIAAHRIAVGRDALVSVVEAFRDAIIQGRRGAVGAADQLGTLLIEPLGLAPGLRLVMVPHGALHYLPFQALRVRDQYLIERNPVSVVPSASIAARLAAAGAGAPADLVAFGNPRIADEYDLPGAEREVGTLAGLFPRHQLFVGAAATKEAFAQAAGRAAVLHVAAHAQADLVDPLYSRVLLAGVPGQPPAPTQFLEAHEILDMDLRGTALVTLSACESGLGKVAQGDEVLGFTRSFLSAGSGSLIASLWPVSDDATAVLMGTLYQALAQGQDVQQAMRAGQLAVLAEPRMSHPFFWAPFNLIGNWRLRFGAADRQALAAAIP